MRINGLHVISTAIAVFSAASLCGAQGLPNAPQMPSESNEAPKEKPAAYVPPLRGAVAQVRRVGGATRGWGDVEIPLMAVIAPDHTGLTTNPSPTLYWYLSRPTSFPIVITVIEEDAIAPLVEHEILPTAVSGFQGFALSAHGLALKPETDYEWSVAIVIDPLERSRDIVAQGTLRLVNHSSARKAGAQGPDADNLWLVYARSGLFYDAFDALSRKIQSSPGADEPRVLRRSLLEQVALPEIASHDASGAVSK